MSGDHPGAKLREVVHQRVRLGVLAVLARRGPCTFTQLRDVLGQSDGGLSRHLGVLERHELIATDKVFEDRRPRTWVRLTAAGADAFREEQALLAELLVSASDKTEGDGTDDRGDDRTAVMAIVFAALLAGDETSAKQTDRSTLIPAVSMIAGRQAEQVASGPISARYEFPDEYADFGREQREQRLMMMSHGLLGGRIVTWEVAGNDQEGPIAAQVMVVELADAADCEAILAVMGEPTVSLSGQGGVRGYLLPAAEVGGSVTALAWFSDGRRLASVVVVADDAVAVSVLDDLVSKVHGPPSEPGS